MNNDFVFVDEFVPGIRWDAKYATWDNFTGAKGITSVEAKNRRYLCSVMEDCGFDRYDYEWWHYTLRHEPYPATYFDFPIVEPANEVALRILTAAKT